MKKDTIITIDIGGTTFESAILSYDKLAILDMSPKDQVRNYSTASELLKGICFQINRLLKKNSIDKSRVNGLSVACPGPLDSKNGIILETPNLKLFQNFSLKLKLQRYFNCEVLIENDANLFALGEWSQAHKKEENFVGITLGTGLGFGVVLNGKMHLGKNGMAAEYGISSCEWGIWEDKVCLKYIKNNIEKIYGQKISPRIIQKYAIDGDHKAKEIFNDFGRNLGVVISHVINMIDPGVIVIGGGLSKAFAIYKEEMLKSISENSPIFRQFPCKVQESKFKSKSHMVGAAINLKTK